MEIWKDIKDYESLYKVSNLGRVKRLECLVNCRGNSQRIAKGKILKLFSLRQYKGAALSKDNKQRGFLVHRLVASAFIPNPVNKPQVNHIDGDKYNNIVTNLEWCTASENTLHAIENNLINFKSGKESPNYGKINKATCKKVIDTETGIVYFSVKDASEKLSISLNYLYQMLRGQRNNKTNLIFYNDAKRSI